MWDVLGCREIGQMLLNKKPINSHHNAHTIPNAEAI
jgi:hypothetical protein